MTVYQKRRINGGHGPFSDCKFSLYFLLLKAKKEEERLKAFLLSQYNPFSDIPHSGSADIS